MNTNEIFDGKTLQDLFKDIYNNREETHDVITKFVLKLASLIKTPEEAALIAPIIANFIFANIKNDEQLISIAQVYQRLQSATIKIGNSPNNILSDDEKLRLLGEIKKEVEKIKETDQEIKKGIDKAGALHVII